MEIMAVLPLSHLPRPRQILIFTIPDFRLFLSLDLSPSMEL